ncbi:UNKNOWN [Stylonychia lemnae]|uniref:Uncharacterized protein n=1 Tax=Stylonychia lemnae TaxID=5949 RepID=A0A077ZYP4_STYLE|nr:UNKNOWN [Stylonychia lemnae]|eukprot:CDW75071.1 UNKNOWN [Stylonychia lemnae]
MSRLYHQPQMKISSQQKEEQLDDEAFYDKFCLNDSDSSLAQSLRSYSFSEVTQSRQIDQTKSYILQHNGGSSQQSRRSRVMSSKSNNESITELSLDLSDKSQIFEYLVMEEKESKLLYSNDKMSSEMLQLSTKSSKYQLDCGISYFFQMASLNTSTQLDTQKQFHYSQLMKHFQHREKVTSFENRETVLQTGANSCKMFRMSSGSGLATLNYKNLIQCRKDSIKEVDLCSILTPKIEEPKPIHYRQFTKTNDNLQTKSSFILLDGCNKFNTNDYNSKLIVNMCVMLEK